MLYNLYINMLIVNMYYCSWRMFEGFDYFLVALGCEGYFKFFGFDFFICRVIILEDGREEFMNCYI